MKMKVTHHKDQKYLQTVIEGSLDMESFGRVLAEMNTVMDRHQCRTVLYDLRKIEIDLETHEIYRIPQLLREEGNADIKRAVLFPENFEQDFTFFETVSSNQGLFVRIFASENEALDWLLS